MFKKTISKIIALITTAACIISAGAVSANAAQMEEGFESVTKDYHGGQVRFSLFSTEGLPSSYSSKDLGYVTEIKQQNYNDCWAYAGLAAFESKLLKSGFNIDSMSTPHLNLWATRHSNGLGWQRTSSGDGYSCIPAGYLISWQGAVEQSNPGLPDFSNDQLQLTGDQVPTNLTKYGATAIKYLTTYDPDEIKRSIVKNGGVFTSYATTPSCYSSDSTAYYMPQSYDGAYSGHSIEIVGWDDFYSRNNFDGAINAKPRYNGAWLVRNSWGNYNSLDGYFWISYEDKYVFGSKYDPSYTIEEVMEVDDKTKLLQNEIYGETFDFKYIISNEITFINRFKFEENFNLLDKVVFSSKAVGADYSIYYIPIENNAPASDKSKWIFLDSGVIDYKGYGCYDIEDFEVPDKDGAIGITLNTENLNAGLSYTDEGYTFNAVGVGEWLIKTDGTYSFLNESHSGESYVCTGDFMMDLMGFYATYNTDPDGNPDTRGGTLIIKAVVKENEAKPTILGDVNLDGVLNIIDATAIQKHISELNILEGVALANADFNCDGLIDITDATSLQKAIVNN